MPKSKRSQIVALTQTAKKTRDHKSTYIQDVREAIDNHDTLYLFSYENMRSSKFKNVRLHFRDAQSNNKTMDSMDDDDQKVPKGSRIFLGKNKLLQIALGRTAEDEYHDNLRQVAKRITGSVGLLFTSRPTQEVQEYFSNLAEADFARAGSIAPRKVVITQSMVETHPVSMMEQFRKLGLPVMIENGRIVMTRDEFVLCKEGDTLSAEACKALVHFGIPLAEFKVQLLCRWNSADSDFEQLD